MVYAKGVNENQNPAGRDDLNENRYCLARLQKPPGDPRGAARLFG
jgi:hypothetical protein